MNSLGGRLEPCASDDTMWVSSSSVICGLMRWRNIVQDRSSSASGWSGTVAP
jgi:hypothetical protein